MGLRHHIRESLKITPEPAYWPKMLMSALGGTLPLILGLYQHQLSISIFGSLLGFTLLMNDHFGTLGHRLWVVTLTFIMLFVGLLLGIVLQDNKPLAVAMLFILTYWAGLMGGQGAELERATVVSIFMFLAGLYTPSLAKMAGPVFAYIAFGYVVVIVGMIITVVLRGHTPMKFARLRATLRYSLTREKKRHLYALAYAVSAGLSWIFVEAVQLNHGYWAVGTVILLMKADQTQSLYRTLQRFLGTLLGVLISEVLIYYVHDPITIIAIVAVAAFFNPWALARNYWLGSTLVSILVLLLLDIPSIGHGDLITPLLRLQATVVGCVVTLIGVLLAKLLPLIFLRKDAE